MITASLMDRFRFWWRYFRNNTPWDSGITPPEIVALAGRLQPGRALDLGCGTGTNVLYLAARGWRAVGVDFVPGAIRRARRKARAAGFGPETVEFHVADVTRLDFLQGPFDLAIDIGCLHTLNAERQRAYAATLTRLTRPGAVFALYAFLPRERNGRTIGIAPDELAQRFNPAFSIDAMTLGKDSSSQEASAWYELRRL